MSFSALVSGADCGPGNALQGLTKRFDGDRGVHLDLYRSAQAGSSKDVFRTQSSDASPQLAQEAAAFFRGNDSLPSTLAQPFDLDALKAALPSSARQTPLAHAPHHASGLSSAWSADFNAHQISPPTVQQASNVPRGAVSSWAADFASQHTSTPLAGTPAYAPSSFAGNLAMQPMHQYLPPIHGTTSLAPNYMTQGAAPMQNPLTQNNQDWASHFNQFEEQTHITEQIAQAKPELVADDLASTAGLLVESMKHETSSKFQNSAFMDLMRKLRDKEVVVEGNDMVSVSSSAKGKAREVPLEAFSDPSTSTFHARPKSVHFYDGLQSSGIPTATAEGFLDWEDDIQEPSFDRLEQPNVFARQDAEWDHLQRDWDAFEAAPHGFRSAMTSYEFQPQNPYLQSGVNRRASSMGNVMYRGVLEREAAVQRSPFDAQAWYELGVKQQENEREQKAIDALSRAVELDPSQLSAWLALAVSYTNENNHVDAHSAIRQWIHQNEKYRIASTRHLTQSPSKFATSPLRHEVLINCLMDMARMTPEGEIDADIQIALAVLLNSTEDYDKAQDCFRAALAVRPDDWLLYNRVGATLANSGRAEEALLYYQKALELNPTYIRARFNMGISCINLGRYEDATSHILDALVLQEEDGTEGSRGTPDASGRGVVSSALWDTLKTASLHMQRHDLAALCEPSQRDLTRYRLEFQNVSQA